MTPRPDPETREAQRRLAEEKRARDFGKFLENLERKARGDLVDPLEQVKL